MLGLQQKGYIEPLKEYLASGKPYMGICVGMQCLFEGSVESPGIPGLGIIKAQVTRFDSTKKAVPHMGWNATTIVKSYEKADVTREFRVADEQPYYFVHSYAVRYQEALKDWVLSTTQYGDELFVSSVQKDNICGTQFHPEKSGFAGLRLLRSFLTADAVVDASRKPIYKTPTLQQTDGLTKRIIACLDVRTNDQGDLVVTKGDQYNVREAGPAVEAAGAVRNLGKPAELSQRYFDEGADEITFLNITSFRDSPLTDQPLLALLQVVSKSIFVPLTIGGGIKDLVDPDGTKHPAVAVAGAYFRSGADKVSIGSDAVEAAEKWYAAGQPRGESFRKQDFSAIGSIAHAYGSQAVVISIDPKKVYVASPEAANGHHTIQTAYPSPTGEKYTWYQCTIKGGRETRDLDVVQLAVACEAMGAGELLVNSIDKDGSNNGYDIELLNMIRRNVSIPVIASSGAGSPDHFDEVFSKTQVEAALAAGIFHRMEVEISTVKDYLRQKGWKVRALDNAL